MNLPYRAVSKHLGTNGERATPSPPYCGLDLVPSFLATRSSGVSPKFITARYFSSNPSDSGSLRTPCSSSEISRWPARHYPRLWIQRPSSERRRDFNPPDFLRAAQRTLRASPATPTPPACPSRASVAHPVTHGASRVACAFLVYMLPPLPRCSGWAYSTLISPSHVSLPRKGHRVGLHIVLFEACSAFTRVAACTLARSPYFVTRYPKASDISSPPCLLRLLPAGAVAGWDLHPLESAAFSRRTPKTVTRRARAKLPKEFRLCENVAGGNHGLRDHRGSGKNRGVLPRG